jgi:hypothetical protein
MLLISFIFSPLIILIAFLHEIVEIEVEETVEDIDIELPRNYNYMSMSMSEIFRGFLTAVILSLELMNESHRRHKEAICNLFQLEEDEGKRKLKLNCVILNSLKAGTSTILFCVTLFVPGLFLPEDDLVMLSVSGLMVQ